MELTSSESAVLEDMVDRVGLMGVVEALAGIATEMAERIQANWQDAGLANCWRKAAGRLRQAAGKLPVVPGIR